LSYEKQIVRSREKAIRPHRVVTLSERGVKRNGSVPDEAVVPVTGEASRKTTGPARFAAYVICVSLWPTSTASAMPWSRVRWPT
jgi:hypothetical protein